MSIKLSIKVHIDCDNEWGGRGCTACEDAVFESGTSADEALALAVRKFMGEGWQVEDVILCPVCSTAGFGIEPDADHEYECTGCGNVFDDRVATPEVHSSYHTSDGIAPCYCPECQRRHDPQPDDVF